MQTAGIYIHIPFCARKCGYCDFNAYSGYKAGTKARYVEALCREIRENSDLAVSVPTVFFGGGTPTDLPADDLIRILDTVRGSFVLMPDAEISVEANPGDASLDYLQTLRRAGFTRLSFGVQTFNDRLLKTLDRLHSGEAARQAVALAREAGFENLSLDLMFALPRQTMADWDRSLDAAFALNVPHLSMYSLIVEEGTPFWARRERGKLPLPSEQAEAAMFERAIQRATAAGYRHYEVSNYARPGFESRHNQIYWRNEDYFGFGAGAVGYQEGVRRRNVDLPSQYVATVERGEPLTIWQERLTPAEALGETLMVGLRMTEGIDLCRIAQRFGVEVREQFATEIAQLTNTGLLEVAGDRLRLTQRGLFLANEVMMAFLP
ncbi:MAG: radical SAM family heme chaperone HemW [Armatimonadaceae bacterium]